MSEIEFSTLAELFSIFMYRDSFFPWSPLFCQRNIHCRPSNGPYGLFWTSESGLGDLCMESVILCGLSALECHVEVDERVEVVCS